MQRLAYYSEIEKSQNKSHAKISEFTVFRRTFSNTFQAFFFVTPDLAPTNARLSGSHGNKFIVTSAPTLHSGNKPTPGNQYSAVNNRELIARDHSEAVENREPAIEEQIILPQQAMKQKTELSRSVSLSQGHPGILI